MFTSITRLPKLALPLLSALLVPIFSTPAPAKAPGSLAARNASASVIESAGREAAVISSSPYQVTLRLTCPGTSHCSGFFPRLGIDRQLSLARMSCHMRGVTNNPTYAYGYVRLLGADQQELAYQMLPGEMTPSGFLLLNQAIDLHVATGQRFEVFMALSGGTAELGICTATGVLDRLQ
jgi:hypothetical protein